MVNEVTEVIKRVKKRRGSRVICLLRKNDKIDTMDELMKEAKRKIVEGRKKTRYVEGMSQRGKTSECFKA